MRNVTISKKKRHRLADVADLDAIALLPAAQRALLVSWVKVKAAKPKWETLLKIAVDQDGQLNIDVAYELATALAACGVATLEQKHTGFVWQNTALIWSDQESLCIALGLSTATSRRTAFQSEWDAANQMEWQRSSLAEAYAALPELPSQRASARLKLLLHLNDWLAQGRIGTRYEFSLFGFGQTKHEISAAEWSWMDEAIGLEDCGIQRHAPALWISGDIQLDFNGRSLDVGALDDAIAITSACLSKLTGARTTATRYRLVENRTSFENLARSFAKGSMAIVIWLPGYAPSWWRNAVGLLLDVCPLPADISCDADPDGVQIAMHAGMSWTERGLVWQPSRMGVSDVSRAKNHLKMTDHDRQLTSRLLGSPRLPSELASLLQWCLSKGLKAEQENWINTGLNGSVDHDIR